MDIIRKKPKMDNFIIIFILFVSYTCTLNIFLNSKEGIRIILTILLFYIFGITWYIRSYKFYINKDMKFIIFFWGLMLLSLVYTKSINYGRIKTLQFLYINMTVYLIPLLMMFSEKQIVKFYNYTIVINITCIIYAVITSYDYIINLNGRLSYYEINPIWIGRFIGETILILIILKSSKHKKFNILKGIILLILSIMLVATGSKGPILSLMISLILLYTIYKSNDVCKRDVFRKVVKVICIIISIMFLFKLILKILPGDFLTLRFSISEGSFDNGRFELYSKSIKSIIDNPFIGTGIGSYSYLTYGIDTRSFPHNIILEVLVELGIVGLLLLAIPIIRVFITILNRVKYKNFSESERLTYSLLVYYLVNSMFSGDLPNNEKIFLYLSLANILMIKQKLKNVN